MDSNNFIEHQGPLQFLQKHNIDHILGQINPIYIVIFKYRLTLYAIRLRPPRDLRLSFFSHNPITVSNLVEITNKMQPCIRIYYSTVHWRLNMFRAVYRSSSGALTVFAASGLHTHVVTGRSQV